MLIKLRCHKVIIKLLVTVAMVALGLEVIIMGIQDEVGEGIMVIDDYGVPLR